MRTIGEQRVRCEFNPSKDGIIDQIKQKSAELINLINDLNLADMPGELPEPINDNGVIKYSSEEIFANVEFESLKEMGCRQVEDGCMWAVKAATIKL